ncbi:MAG: 50S ribosomal protein L23 [Verrucomicrobia bacterium]|nr:50S ribosomal protein L23 [Verrucomicrobiota bacterium]
MKTLDKVIKRLYVTEKGTELSEKVGKYFFEVAHDANKLEIKKAVEELYKVGVVKVNTLQYGGKKKRLRSMKYGKRPDWKKAIVTLKKGDKIEIA